jgi:hypothetical protein
MTKSQSNTAFQNSNTQNAQENTNAQSSYNAAQGDVGDYQSQLAQFSSQNPFVQGGQYQTSQNQGLADTAAAGSQATAQAIESAGVRSGQNPSAGIAAAEQVGEADNRNQAADVDQANQQRMQGLTSYNSNVLNASTEPEKMEAGLSSGENSAADSSLGDEQKASQTPSFWQQLGPALISGGAQVGSAFCPARGSLYLMADTTQVRVEDLKVGDQILGIDLEPQTIEEIQVAVSPVLKVRTEDGHVVRNSRVHAFALPLGGFTVAINSLGKTIRTAHGKSKVVSVEWDGSDEVYNVITDGSHTYRADGVWALGVGEAERQVTMEHWNEIGDMLAFEKQSAGVI